MNLPLDPVFSVVAASDGKVDAAVIPFEAHARVLSEREEEALGWRPGEGHRDVVPFEAKARVCRVRAIGKSERCVQTDMAEIKNMIVQVRDTSTSSE